MSWDTYAKPAEVSTGGEFPVIDDDLYSAVVKDVSEPVEEANKFKEKDTDPDFVTRFYVSWELISGDAPEGTTLRQYISLPQAYLDHGALGPKSTLHKVMTALGIDMTGRFRVDPPSWQGMEARVMVECPRETNLAAGTITQTGWPRITGVKPKRGATPVAAKAPTPVAAKAGRSKSEDAPWE